MEAIIRLASQLARTGVANLAPLQRDLSAL